MSHISAACEESDADESDTGCNLSFLSFEQIKCPT